MIIDDLNDVGADLGYILGMDCEVDNQLVFNEMDRYTGSGAPRSTFDRMF